MAPPNEQHQRGAKAAGELHFILASPALLVIVVVAASLLLALAARPAKV